MENQDFLQLSTVNSFLPNLGQHQDNIFPGDLLQNPNTNLKRSGSFRDQIKIEVVDIEINIVEYDQYFSKNILIKSASGASHFGKNIR